MKQSPHVYLVLVVFIPWLPAVGQVASDGSLPERNKFDAVEVVTKAPSDNELRRRSLVAKRIYGREELDRFGDNNLADVLSNLPGVQMRNGSPALSGMDPKYTKILFNGDPAPAGVSMEQINPSLIQRIEIVRGQSANQSAQSIGGTINIFFKDPPSSSTETIRYGAAYQNERPTPFVTYTIGGKAGDLAYNLPFSLQELLQTFQVNSEKGISASDGALSRGYQEKYWRYGHLFATFSPRFVYTINDDEKLTWQSFIQASQRKLLHRFERTVLSGDPQLDSDYQVQTDFRVFKSDLAWVKNFSETDRVEAKVGASSNFFDGCWKRSVFDQALSTGCSESTVTNARYGANYMHILNNEHVMTVGFEIDRKWQDDRKTETYLGSLVNPLVEGARFYGSIDNTALFVQDEWAVNREFAVNMGLRAERLRLGVNVPIQLISDANIASNASNTWSMVNPVVQFSYRPNPADKRVWRGGISKGYKAPDINSLGLLPFISYRDTTRMNTAVYPDDAGNSALKPETATGLDLSYETPFAKNSFLSLGGFYRDVDNIVADVTTLQTVYYASSPRWVRQPTNFSRGTSYGIEVELRAGAGDVLPASLVPERPLNLRLNVNYYGSHVDGIPGPNNRFPSQYPWTTTIGFDYKPIDALTLGGSLFVSPEYQRQVYTAQTLSQSKLRWINAFVQYKIDGKSSLRVGLNNVGPTTNGTTLSTESSDLHENRWGRTTITVTMESRL